ncbi:translation initiation factor IF-2 [Streptomyces violaceusniger Tu 4113]|uniref:Translation initiation factor IF-2 n=1 Tax=Streptomyces violaceusniger (strain Tu 4113) TaxID=653045 RepID=G2P8Q3_STRV4|nr:translation initiation factor IF-2 [Streptomyces violaceusniger Tu 4113]
MSAAGCPPPRPFPQSRCAAPPRGGAPPRPWVRGRAPGNGRGRVGCSPLRPFPQLGLRPRPRSGGEASGDGRAGCPLPRAFARHRYAASPRGRALPQRPGSGGEAPGKGHGQAGLLASPAFSQHRVCGFAAWWGSAPDPGPGAKPLATGGQVARFPARSRGIGMRLRRVAGLCPRPRVRGRSHWQRAEWAGCSFPRAFSRYRCAASPRGGAGSRGGAPGIGKGRGGEGSAGRP